MLNKAAVVATIAVKNLQRAKKFYTEVLGLKPSKAFPNGIIMQAGTKTAVGLYHQPKNKVGHTVAWFTVADFDKTVAQLLDKGVKFNRYDLPGYDELGEAIYKFGKTKVAWFSDSEGNILAISGQF